MVFPLIFKRSRIEYLKPKMDYKIYRLLVKPSARSPRVFKCAGIFKWMLRGADLPDIRALIPEREYRSLVLILSGCRGQYLRLERVLVCVNPNLKLH